MEECYCFTNCTNGTKSHMYSRPGTSITKREEHVLDINEHLRQGIQKWTK